MAAKFLIGGTLHLIYRQYIVFPTTGLELRDIRKAKVYIAMKARHSFEKLYWPWECDYFGAKVYDVIVLLPTNSNYQIIKSEQLSDLEKNDEIVAKHLYRMLALDLCLSQEDVWPNTSTKDRLGQLEFIDFGYGNPQIADLLVQKIVLDNLFAAISLGHLDIFQDQGAGEPAVVCQIEKSLREHIYQGKIPTDNTRKSETMFCSSVYWRMALEQFYKAPSCNDVEPFRYIVRNNEKVDLKPIYEAKAKRIQGFVPTEAQSQCIARHYIGCINTRKLNFLQYLLMSMTLRQRKEEFNLAWVFPAFCEKDIYTCKFKVDYENKYNFFLDTFPLIDCQTLPYNSGDRLVKYEPTLIKKYFKSNNRRDTNSMSHRKTASETNIVNKYLATEKRRPATIDEKFSLTRKKFEATRYKVPFSQKICFISEGTKNISVEHIQAVKPTKNLNDDSRLPGRWNLEDRDLTNLEDRELTISVRHHEKEHQSNHKEQDTSLLNKISAGRMTTVLEESNKISHIPMNHRTPHFGHENYQKNEQEISLKIDIAGPRKVSTSQKACMQLKTANPLTKNVGGLSKQILPININNSSFLSSFFPASNVASF